MKRLQRIVVVDDEPNIGQSLRLIPAKFQAQRRARRARLLYGGLL
jgi:hypothetical protein